MYLQMLRAHRRAALGLAACSPRNHNLGQQGDIAVTPLPPKLPYPLFFGAFADQNLPVLLGNYVTVKPLEGYFAGGFYMDYAVRTFEEAHISYRSVAVGILCQLIMQ